MNLEVDDDVCNLLRLSCFPGLDYDFDNSDGLVFAKPVSLSFDSFKTGLISICQAYDDETDADGTWTDQSIYRMSAVLAATSDKQKKAEEYLEKLGFTKVFSSQKLKHVNSVVSYWMMGAYAFMRAVGYEPEDMSYADIEAMYKKQGLKIDGYNPVEKGGTECAA